MSRKRKYHLFLTVLFMILIVSFTIPLISNNIFYFSNNDEPSNDNPLYISYPSLYSNSNKIQTSSISLEGIDNIKVTQLTRSINMKGTGLLSVEDILTIKNENNFSVSSILIGIPTNNSNNLIFYQARTGIIPHSSQKTDFVIKENFQTIVINLFTPIQSNETILIEFIQYYKDNIDFESIGTIINPDEKLTFTGYVFPILPYEVEGDISTEFILPEGQHEIIDRDWGTEIGGNKIKFEWTQGYLEPFLDNMGTKKTISVSVKDSSTTNLEVSQLFRTITISPWGIIKLKENYFIKNNGTIPVEQFEINIPEAAVNLEVYDFLGDLKIGETEVTQEQDISGIYFTPNPLIPGFQKGTFRISQFRGKIQPGSTYQFTLEYQLNLYDYISFSWFQQSFQMNLFPSYFEYLGRNQITTIMIDGASGMNSISKSPNGITNSRGEITITYFEEYLVPPEMPLKIVAFNYNLDVFKLLSWPILYIVVIASLCSIFVIIVKKRKVAEIIPEIEKEELPIKEIREFCSLYAEKHALMLEITKAEEDLKNKKLPKKKYRVITKRNEAKIKTIEEELEPFRETLMETNETFNNIINTIDVLETERQTIEDGIKLLEARYRRGKIPSRSAYASLSNDFIKRLNKVEKSIDKSIQQLRSYTL
jgi:hypothetical protein